MVIADYGIAIRGYISIIVNQAVLLEICSIAAHIQSPKRNIFIRRVIYLKPCTVI